MVYGDVFLFDLYDSVEDGGGRKKWREKCEEIGGGEISDLSGPVWLREHGHTK